MPWQAVLGLVIAALLFFALDARNHWRQAWWHTAVLFFLLAWAWRMLLHADARRYYSVLILPGMLLIFHMFRVVAASRWRKISLIAFPILIAVCIARDFRGNLQEFKVISLYEKVGRDAGHHSSPFGIAFPSKGHRESFYVGFPVTGIDDDKKMLADFLRAQKGNLNIYGGMGDALYLFLFIPADFPNREEALKELTADGMEIVGHEFLDRKHNKALWVLKYLPRETKIDSSGAELLPNGDFSQTLTGDELKKSLRNLGRRAPRFLSESPELPKLWSLYQPPTSFNNNWGGVEKRDHKNVLRLQTDSYLVAISPRFDIRGKGEERIFFTVRANKPSQLDIARVYRNPGSEYSIMFKLSIPAGSEREYSFVLPQSSKGHNSGSVHFWLSDGDIELSDVKILSPAVSRKTTSITTSAE